MSLSPPQTKETLNVELGKFLRRIYSSRSEILEYDDQKKNLSVWPWPRDPFTGERLTPRALYGYILSAEGTGPRCLCNHKSFDAIQQGSHASVIRVEAGAHAGEYIAACPIKQCGYIVPLERIHRNGRFSHPFAPKFDGRDSHLTGAPVKMANRLKRTYAALATDLSESESDLGPLRARGHTTFTIRHLEPPTSRRTTDTDLLTRLNSWVQPGLYEREFRELMQRMRQCSCGMFMIQDVFNEHRCEKGMFVTVKRVKIE